MTGHRSFSELTAGLDASRCARVEALSHLIGSEIELAGLRSALGISEADATSAMSEAAEALAPVEAGDNLTVGQLGRYVEALGGQLRIVADFDGQQVEIKLPTPAG
jgi:hypothetical protein